MNLFLKKNATSAEVNTKVRIAIVVEFIIIDCSLKIHPKINIPTNQVLAPEHEFYKPLPEVRNINNQMIQLCYEEIKKDIDQLVTTEFEKVMMSPDKTMLVKKNS